MIFDLHAIHKIVKITGAIHVGAFAGEELTQYRSLGLTNTVLFEPQAKLYEIVRAKCILNEQVYNVALGSESGTAEMFISDRKGGIEHGAGASSSILEPKHHLSEHPEVTFPAKETVEICRFDKIAPIFKNISDYNLLNIDVQGYELEVLKGFGDYLSQIEIIICEVNRKEMYANCPLIEDIDEYLFEHGFRQVGVAWQSEGWGDALYVRK